jgi:hygromycin-B 7''-O-kinase
MSVPTIDVDIARRLIGPIDASFVVAGVAPVAGGGNSDVSIAHARDGRSIVIKAYSDELHWKMRKEVFAYGLLEAVPPSVPLADLLVADDTKRLFDRNYIVMTKLEGTLLISVIDAMDPAALDVIDREIGAALAAMHRVELEAFGYLGQDGVGEPFATNTEYMAAQFNKKLGGFDEFGGDRSTLRAVRRYVERHADLFDDCPTAVFCHDDCHEGNVFVSDTTGGWHVTGIIDLENAVAGDPLLDLAKTEAYRRHRSERRLDALLEGYGPLRPAWRSTLDLYTLYHWLELWDWFAAHDRREPLAGLAQDMLRICDDAG